MVLLFYVRDCLMFSSSKDKIDEVYASLRGYFNIKDDEELNKYLGIDLYRRPDASIYLRQPYLTKIIPNMIPGMEKSSANPTHAVKPPVSKNDGAQERKIYFNYGSGIGLLNLLTNSIHPEAQSAAHRCARFIPDARYRMIERLNAS